MTDKEQIIIDGVDVSECLFYQINFEEDYEVKIEHFCSNWHNSCESVNNSNCYYKQLAHKTKECEDLREALKEEIIYKRTYLKSLLDCKEACEALKSKIHDLRQLRELDREARVRFYNQVCKYSEALEEIKKYINNQGINNKWNMRIQRFKSEILDIINKVKEN